jgi:hypothetical protein
LLAKSKLTPIVACTDSEAVLAVREFVRFPVVWVLDGAADQSLAAQFQIAKSQAAAAPQFAEDEQTIRAAWPAQADHLDLLEPFTRIREALEEAQKTARQAA